MPQVIGLTPILCVQDVVASMAYYVNQLGFKKNWDWTAPNDPTPGFACVSRGEACIFLCRQGQGQAGTWMSIFVDDVDAFHAEYQQRGARIVEPPTDYPWGMREMRVMDLDGHMLRFGHGMAAAPQPVKPADGE